jgi:hypothetical protein
MSSKRKPNVRFLLRCAALAAAFFFTSCAQRDPLEEAAWQASRHGTAAGDRLPGGPGTGLGVGSRIVERYYAVAKYQATQEQRLAAEAAGRQAAAQIVRKAPARGGKKPRYLAVRTRQDTRAKTSTSVMIWDVETSQIVGNNVYDLNEPPPTGAAVKFETYTAQFVAIEG